MYYVAPETPMMSSVVADCQDLAPPNILDKSTPMDKWIDKWIYVCACVYVSVCGRVCASVRVDVCGCVWLQYDGKVVQLTRCRSSRPWTLATKILLTWNFHVETIVSLATNVSNVNILFICRWLYRILPYILRCFTLAWDCIVLPCLFHFTLSAFTTSRYNLICLVFAVKHVVLKMWARCVDYAYVAILN